MKNKLITSVKDPKTFWSTLKTISCKRKETGNALISKDDWLDHFASVFGATTEPQQHEDNVHGGHVHEGLPDTFNLQLNGDISHDEVTKAINDLKQNKAGGADTLIIMLIYIAPSNAQGASQK